MHFSLPIFFTLANHIHINFDALSKNFHGPAFSFVHYALTSNLTKLPNSHQISWSFYIAVVDKYEAYGYLQFQSIWHVFIGWA